MPGGIDGTESERFYRRCQPPIASARVMSQTDPTAGASTILFRIVAVLVLFLSITAGGLQVLASLSLLDHPDPSAPVPAVTLFIPPLLSLIAGIALSTLLEGVARVVGCQPAQPADHTAAEVNLMMTVAELQNSLPAQIAEAVQQAVSQIQVPPGESSGESAITAQHLERLVKLMEEMKELSMLDDGQRQSRRKQTTARRKNSRLEEAHSLIEQRNLAQADALLHLLESLHPGDPEVLALRNQLDDARLENQSADFENLDRQVADLLALSKYPEAIEGIDQFLETYPAHDQARQLSQRIRSEQQIHLDTTSNRLYEQIKAAVEARQWRTALDGIQDFLDRYPEHPRAEKIRKQVRVIQKNAEIEERHEQEDHIRQLINDRRFGEAADLSEDLLQRFPDSPQSAYLTELLPKLRERSAAIEQHEDIVT
jgi:outer membrane protein assembly factor BamD (BamD/ComL family)